MGNKLFGVDVAKIVHDNISPGVLDATIKNYTLGDRDPNNPTAGRQRVPTSHDCKGFWEDVRPSLVDGDRIQVDDRLAVIIGDSIPDGAKIKRGSTIKIEGMELTVQFLYKRDPAAAVFQYLCRDTKGADGQ